MYRLTARMLQRFKRDLEKYHELFAGGRCSGWEQEELIVAAIKSDTTAHHHVIWSEAGHDTKADIQVRTNGDIHLIEIKSGKIDSKGRLVLSGYRMGTYKDNWQAITDYLKSKQADLLSVAYEQINDDKGRRHIYKVSYIDAEILRDISADAWQKVGAQYKQANSTGVEFSVCPSMSWQIWWAIPLEHVVQEEPFIIQ